MFLVIGWEDHVIWQSLMMMTLLLYHITIIILKSFQTNIPHTIILVMLLVLVASPWPIVKRAEYIQHTFQHSCSSKIFAKQRSLVNSRQQTVDLSPLQLRPSTFIGHTSAWWQQTLSSINESEFCYSHQCRHILQTYRFDPFALSRGRRQEARGKRQGIVVPGRWTIWTTISREGDGKSREAGGLESTEGGEGGSGTSDNLSGRSLMCFEIKARSSAKNVLVGVRGPSFGTGEIKDGRSPVA
jgi:hypothetical protein